MVRSNGVLTFLYFYQLGKTAWTSTLYFLVTSTDVTLFEINVETLLFASVNFFINWLRYKSNLGLRTVSCHATQIEHLPKFELKTSILNRVVPQVLFHNLTK